MLKNLLPHVRLEAKPKGLKFRAPDSAVAKFDKSIRLAKPSETDIEIFGFIGDEEYGGVGVKTMKNALKAAGKNAVNVSINSPGGDAFAGIAMYNLLREHSARVTVNVIGNAASAASVIAMAGDTVKMSPAASLMIHSASGLVMGNEQDMIEFAEVLAMLDGEVAAVYAARTGKPVAEILEMMKKETWMNGDQAVEMGFADIAIKDDKKKAKAEFSPQILAALGKKAYAAVHLSARPGASGKPYNHSPKDTNMKTIQQQITDFENKRAAGAARMDEIMLVAGNEGRTLDETETQEYESIKAEVGAIDAHLLRLKAHEKTMVQQSAAPAKGADPDEGSKARSASKIISVAANVEPGIRFARMALSLYNAKGNRQEAARIFQSNQRWMDQTPEVHKVLMTAVPAADSTTSGWASELAYAENIQSEFIEYLRPMTIIGRLTGVRRVPFNMRTGSLTAGTTGYWVGQGKPIPMSKGTTGSTSLGITKAAGIAAYDEEILKLSSPSIELMVRDDLAKAVAQAVDVAFIDPNNGGDTNIKPASVLYGVTPIAASGTNAAAVATDVAAVFQDAIDANLNPMSGVWVMTPTTALKLSLMLTANGVPQYPGISINGGTWQGLPVIVSQNAYISGSPNYENMIVLLLQNEILMADDGGVDIQISSEASLEMLDNPTNTSTGGTTATTMVSMFQTQSMAMKAVRYVNWTKRRAEAAAFIRGANYAAS